MITRFDSVNNPDWESVYDHSRFNANQMVPVTVERGGQDAQLSLRVPTSAKSDNFEFSDTGISPQYSARPHRRGGGATGHARGTGRAQAGDADRSR